MPKNAKSGGIAAVNKQRQEHPEWYDGSYTDSPTAGLTKANFAQSTEGFAMPSNSPVPYRYRATRELGIQDQISTTNAKQAAYDTTQYNKLDGHKSYDLTTSRGIWDRIYDISSTDPVLGKQLSAQAEEFKLTPGNPLYNPYAGHCFAGCQRLFRSGLL